MIYIERGYTAAYEEVVRHLEGLSESGNDAPLKEVGPVNMSFMCYRSNQDDKAMEWLEKGFEMHHPHMPYIFTGFWNFSRLHDNPRFIKIAEKMNLPLPKN